MQRLIEFALDKLTFPRSSPKAQEDALISLERLLAELLLVENGRPNQENLAMFLHLQNSFRCNISSRAISWLAQRADTLKKIKDRKESSSTNALELNTTVQALFILQGVALLHHPTKEFLGRRSSMEVLLGLLSICRHSRPFSNTEKSGLFDNGSMEEIYPIPLASAILDTLLCVLVDSPAAIRTFEDSSGLELIVKILRRAAIPRGIRMKCLEFLYFYLMDENSPAEWPTPNEVPTRPASPVKPNFSYSTRPSGSPHPRSTPFASTAVAKPTPAGITSPKTLLQQLARNESSSFSMTSDYEIDSSPSRISSYSPTPTLLDTPIPSRFPSKTGGATPLKRPLEMLGKDVDYVPTSPKKSDLSRLGADSQAARMKMRVQHLKSLSADSNICVKRSSSPLGRTSSSDDRMAHAKWNPSMGWNGVKGGGTDASEDEVDDIISENEVCNIRPRTMEEKKEILGQLLGNVDALVDSVKKAGIWGLSG